MGQVAAKTGAQEEEPRDERWEKMLKGTQSPASFKLHRNPTQGHREVLPFHVTSDSEKMMVH